MNMKFLYVLILSITLRLQEQYVLAGIFGFGSNRHNSGASDSSSGSRSLWGRILRPQSGSIRAISVFPWTEPEFHKYAAILAASEPYRVQRDEDIKSSMGPLEYLAYRASGSDASSPQCPIRSSNFMVDSACRAFEEKTRQIVHAYGLNIKTFNNITEQLIDRPHLRRQIGLQSYYYKLAADLEDNLRPPVRPLPLLAPQPLTSALASAMRNPLRAIFSLGSSASGIKGGSILGSDDMYSEYQLEAFCKALLLVETEREKSLRNLQKRLHTDVPIPANMCDPATLPLMSKEVQRACSAFPQAADRALRAAHMRPSAFFDLLQTELPKNRGLKRRVDTILNRLKKEAASSSSGVSANNPYLSR